MKMTKKILFLVIICCLTIQCKSEIKLEAKSKRPNIILILADDLGFSDLGCYGGEIKTPNIDALAKNGLRFTQLYNSARCCPSRASLMTGLYPHQTGIGFMTADNGKPGYRGFLNDRCVTTASLLHEDGYNTYLSGKWHLGGKENSEFAPKDYGFNEFYGLPRDYASFYRDDIYFRLPKERKLLKSNKPFYATDAITDYGLHFIDDARKKDKPYFLYLAYNAPHFPLQAPKEAIDKYVEIYEKGWDTIRQERHERLMELGIFAKEYMLSERGLVPEIPERNKDSEYYGKKIPAWDSLSVERRKDLTRRMATYAAMVDIMDQNIGRLVKDLKVNNELDNTVIFFLSDNGACAEWDPFGFDNNPYPKNKLYQGEDLAQIGQTGTFHSYGTGWANASNTPFTSYKHYSYEGGISTPAIIHYPKNLKNSGKINRQPHHIMDIPATILDLAQVNYPSKWQGKEIYPIEGESMLPIINGQHKPERVLYFEHEGNRAVREGNLKLVWANYSKKWELYNIEKDRTETHNIASQYPDKVKKLNDLWHVWAERCHVEKNKLEVTKKGMPTIYYLNE